MACFATIWLDQTDILVAQPNFILFKQRYKDKQRYKKLYTRHTRRKIVRESLLNF